MIKSLWDSGHNYFNSGLIILNDRAIDNDETL